VQTFLSFLINSFTTFQFVSVFQAQMTDVVHTNGAAKPMNGAGGYDSKPLLELYVKVSFM
jgi:hypothetical protein